MPGLYENINRRKKAGTSRPKSRSTIDPDTYRKMGTPGFDRSKSTTKTSKKKGKK